MNDLREQVRDLMFYLETQKKIAESPDGARQVNSSSLCLSVLMCVCVKELQDGQVVVGPSTSPTPSSSSAMSTGSSSRKGRKKR